MEIFQLILLLIAYSLGVATFIIQIICYLKELEYKETLFFTIAFLLLIIASTFQEIIKADNTNTLRLQEFIINLLTIVFAVSIPINVHKERVDKHRKSRNSIIIAIGVVVAVFTVVFQLYFSSTLIMIVISTHLFLSVIYSMFFLLLTKPGFLIKDREKSERLLAVVVLIIMGGTLLFFVLNVNRFSLNVMQQNGGVVLAVICIVLAISKIPDDIKKLVKTEESTLTVENQLTVSGLTPREQEVLSLLVTGSTYKEIAGQLYISLPTVKTHVSNIYSKAQVRNRLELSNLIRQKSVGV